VLTLARRRYHKANRPISTAPQTGDPSANLTIVVRGR
jgi:hypothetical protein